MSACTSARAQSVWQGVDTVMETTDIQTVTPADGQRFYESLAGRCLPLTHTRAHAHAHTHTHADHTCILSGQQAFLIIAYSW